jgi:DnaK suppressor protein
MNDLTKEQRSELQSELEALSAELSEILSISADSVKPVDLGEPIGRVSRMDAIQQQKMAESNRRAAKARLERVHAALSALQRDDAYGECRECEEPIGYGRLKARPESRLCIKCQGAREAR